MGAKWKKKGGPQAPFQLPPLKKAAIQFNGINEGKQNMYVYINAVKDRVGTLEIL